MRVAASGISKSSGLRKPLCLRGAHRKLHAGDPGKVNVQVLRALVDFVPAVSAAPRNIRSLEVSMEGRSNRECLLSLIALRVIIRRQSRKGSRELPCFRKKDGIA